MAGVFEDVVFEWEGVEYKIPAERVMRTIAEVEEVITLTELSSAAERMNIPMARLALAFTVVLRAAGVKGVTQEVMYEKLFASAADQQTQVFVCIDQLLALMLPPSARKRQEDGGEQVPAPLDEGTTSPENATS